MTEYNSTKDEAKGKAFGIVRTTDPDSLLAIHTRQEVCEHPTLSDGAVRLFCRLLDAALDPKFHGNNRGQVTIPQEDLAWLIHRSVTSIRRWTSELVQAGYLWTSRVPRRNTYPMLRYHITVFQERKRATEDFPGDGIRVNGHRRSEPKVRPESRSRRATGQFDREGGLLVDQFGNRLFFEKPNKSASERSNYGPASGQVDHSQQPPENAVSGQVDRSQRPPETAHSGQVDRSQRPPETAEACRWRLTSIEPQSEYESQTSISETGSTRLATRAGAEPGRKKRLEAEKAKLDLVSQVVGARDVEKNGGLWRTLIREDWGTLNACLLDAQQTKRDRPGEIKKSPAAHVIWWYQEIRRLNGKREVAV